MNNSYNLKTYDLGNSPSPELIILKSKTELPRGATIIDVGCGTGRHSIYLANQNYNVIGVDSSENAINELRKKIIDFYQLNIEVFVGDFSKLNFNQDYFDAGIAWRIFHIGFENVRQRIVASFHRVLKPGSVAFLSMAAAQGAIFEERKRNCPKPKEYNTLEYISEGNLHTKHYFEKKELPQFLTGFEILDVNLFDEHSGHGKKALPQTYWSIIAKKK